MLAAMGVTFIEVAVAHPSRPELGETLEFLVDSGAIYSVVPGPILDRLGIAPLAEQTFRLANGAKVVRKKGVAVFRYRDRIGGADVIFGETDDAVLLGAFTLEALGLCLDPLKRELTPLPMILAQVAVAETRAIASTSSRTCDADVSSAFRSPSVSAISMTRSTPPAPSWTGTPT